VFWDPLADEYKPVQTADVNGDGLTDIVATNGTYSGILPANAYDTSKVVPSDPTYGRNVIVSLISNGDGTFNKVVYEDVMTWSALDRANPSSCQKTMNKLIVADFNGDGFADLSRGSFLFYMGLGDGKYLKQGNRFIEGDDVAGTGGAITTMGIRIPDTTYGSYAFDINRDGNPDVVEVVVDKDGLRIGTNAYAEGISQQYVNKVTDGYGRETDIIYQSLSSNKTYTKGSGSAYPIKDIGSGFTVVDKVISSDGVGGRYTVDYQYEGMRADLGRQQLLGFASISVSDSRSGISTITDYSQSFPLVGQVLSERTYTSEGVLLSKNIHNSDYVSVTNHIGNHDYTWYTLRKLSHEQQSYNTDGSHIGTVSTTNEGFDIFGKPSRVTTESSDGYLNIQDYVIENNSNWDGFFVGRIRSLTETTNGQDYLDTRTRSSEYYYLSNGLLDYELREPNKVELYQKTDYEYDPYGRIISASISGHPSAAYPVQTRTTQKQYNMPSDGDGNMEVVTTNPEGHITKEYYDVKYGRLISSIDQNGLKAEYVYDDFGEILAELRPDGTSTTFTRDLCDLHCPENAKYRIFSRASGQSFVENYYDLYDRVLRSRSLGIDGKTIYTDSIYNIRGDLVYESQPYFTGSAHVLYSEYQYDILKRVRRTDTPEEGIASFEYYALDGRGTRITKTTAREGLSGSVNLQTVQLKNLANNPTKAINADGHETHYKYNSSGQLKEIIDPLGNSITINYDELDRVVSLDDPDLGLAQFDVDSFSQTRRSTDAKRQVVRMDYDRLGRMINRLKNEGRDSWVYDTAEHGVGKVAVEEAAGGAIKRFYYDTLGRTRLVNHKIDGKLYDFVYGYDFASRLSSITYPTGFNIKNQYHKNGYLEKVYNETTTFWNINNLNAKGERLSETYGNGISTAYGYNNSSGRIESVLSSSGSNRVQDLSFAFDSLGNLVQRQDLRKNLTERFEYDKSNRLTNVHLNSNRTLHMEYNQIGNILSKSNYGSSYTYGEDGAGPHAVTTITDLDGHEQEFAYDDNGNMTDGHDKSIVYTSYDKPKTIHTSTLATTFEYDANEKRVRKYSDSSVTVYIDPRWNRGIHYEEEISTGSIKRKHYINAGDVPIAIYESNGNGSSSATRYLHKDHLGSVTEITDQDGKLVESLSYEAFGKRRNSDWTPATAEITSSVTHHGFTGHEHLDESGLIHMNARLYDPQLGRFISADTIIPSVENVEALNRYSYVFNNPLSLTDSSGNFPDIFTWIANTFGSQFSGRFGTLSTAVTTTNSANSYHSEVNHNSTIVGISQTPDSTLNISTVSEFAVGNMKGVVNNVYGDYITTDLATETELSLLNPAFSIYGLAEDFGAPAPTIQNIFGIQSTHLLDVPRTQAGLNGYDKSVYTSLLVALVTRKPKQGLNSLKNLFVTKAADSVKWKGFSKGKLSDHYEKHVLKQKEFGDISQAEYLKQAKGFAKESGKFNEANVGNFVIKHDPASGRVLVGHGKSREIRTFYRDDGRHSDAFQAAIDYAKGL
jgi:RHS repeat-associated protein